MIDLDRKIAISVASVGAFWLAALASCHSTPGVDCPTPGDAAIESEAEAGDAGADAGDGSVWCPGAQYVQDVRDALAARATTCCAAVGVDLSPPAKQTALRKAYAAGWLDQANAGADLATIGLVQCGPTITYHPELGAACLAAVTAQACSPIAESEYNAITAACFGVFTGNVADGNACHVSVECGAGSFCDLTFADAGAGTCRPLIAQGATCSSFSATHEYPCSHMGLGSACDHTCIAPRPGGESIVSTPLECAAGMLGADFKCAAVDGGATWPNYSATICGFF